MNPLRIAFFLAWLAIGLSAFSPARSQALVVGGKDFTEQLLIAELTSRFLRAKGYTVRTRTGFSSVGVRREQEAGLIDVYWEYTGTSLISFNSVAEKLGPEQTYERVREIDGRKGLVWLRPSKVNNTYALAMRKTDAEARGISSISDLAAKVRRGETFRLACNIEFYIRSDGLLPLERAYGFEFGPENVVRMATGSIYDVLRDSAEIEVGLVFSTDGRVAAHDLVVLRDDRGFFPSYLLTPVVRQKTLEQNPGLGAHLNTLSEKLDNAVMAKLNRMVDVDRRQIGEVATAFLQESGLL